jgi:ribosomal protein S11
MYRVSAGHGNRQRIHCLTLGRNVRHDARGTGFAQTFVRNKTHMTVTHVGSNANYAAGWEGIFTKGAKKKAAPAAKQGTAKAAKKKAAKKKGKK